MAVTMLSRLTGDPATGRPCQLDRPASGSLPRTRLAVVRRSPTPAAGPHGHVGPGAPRWRSARTDGCWPAPATTRRCGCGTRPPASQVGRSPATPARCDAVAFSPDGRLLATAGADEHGAAVGRGHRRRRAAGSTGHTDRVHAVAFSPDGDLLATASGDGDGAAVGRGHRPPAGAPLTGHTDWVQAVAFSPDGTLWPAPAPTARCGCGTRPPAGRRRAAHRPHRHGGRRWRSARTARLLATASDDGTVRLWDAGHRPPTGAPLTGHTGGV